MQKEHIQELEKLLGGDQKLIDHVVAEVDKINKQGEKPTAVVKEITDPQAQLLAVATSLKEANPEAAQQIEASVAALKAPEPKGGELPVEPEPPPVVAKADDPKPTEPPAEPETLEEAIAILKGLGTRIVEVQKEVVALKADDAPRIVTIHTGAGVPDETPAVEKTRPDAPKVVQEISAVMFGQAK